MIIRIHTCKSTLNLFFLEPYLQLLQRDFTNQHPPVSSSSSFSSVDTYLSSLSFEHVTCTPSPNFSTDLAFFREWFLWRLGGGGRPPSPPPLATPLRHIFERKSQKLCQTTELAGISVSLQSFAFAAQNSNFRSHRISPSEKISGSDILYASLLPSWSRHQDSVK
jgi:hypothetical protein